MLERRHPCVKTAALPAQEHARASVVLALVREQLSADEFSALLRLFQAGSWQLIAEPPAGLRARLWASEVRATLDDALLDASAVSRRRALRRLIHLYGHLLEGPQTVCSIAFRTVAP